MIGRLVALCLAAVAGPAAAQSVAIVHARAWTMTSEAPVEDATILVQDGRIVSVAAHGAAPQGAEVIDAKGQTVTPGLMNAGTQLGLVEVAGDAGSDDRAVATGPVGAAFDVRYALNAESALVPVARADGLTRAVVYPQAAGQAPFAGAGAVIRLDGELLERPDAAIYVSVGEQALAAAGGSRAAQWVLLRNALDEARAYVAAPHERGPRDQLLDRIDIEALAKALQTRTPLVISAQRASDIREAIRLAADYHLPVVVFGGAEAWRQAGQLAAAKIQVILDPLADLPQDFDQLGARLDNAAILQRAGVPIAFSVSGNGIYRSYDAGLALREGAGMAVANGLPYAAALRAMTTAPAAMFGVADHYGALAPGADADLVIWDGDPLEMTTAPVRVFIQGREQDLRTRQAALRDRYAPSHAHDPLPPAYH